MEFLILGYDGTDDGARERRLAAREAHLAMIARLRAGGNVQYGAAILNEEQQMVGSMLVADFPSRAELDTWLAEEPYVTGNVWQTLEIRACKTAPSFLP